ncbi:hypothetical protein JCM8547_007704 [Rhodosporidiobolus lusitaniae]
MPRLTLLFLLPISLLVFISLLPSLVSAQFDQHSPACCRDCYSQVLTRVNNGEFAGLTTGDTMGRCDSTEFQTALEDCWNATCTNTTDIQTGIDTWGKACSYATSTMLAHSSLMSSLAERVATETTLAIMKRSPATAAPVLLARATDSTNAGSSSLRAPRPSFSSSDQPLLSTTAGTILTFVMAFVATVAFNLA